MLAHKGWLSSPMLTALHVTLVRRSHRLSAQPSWPAGRPAGRVIAETCASAASTTPTDRTKRSAHRVAISPAPQSHPHHPPPLPSVDPPSTGGGLFGSQDVGLSGK
jgi:hypothetical protein